LPESDLALLVAAAEAAGQEALRFWKRNPKVWDKGAEGPVTEADIAVNDLLHARLTAARPDYAWLSEESPQPEGWSGRTTLIVDPIDGTRAFIAGESSFAQALAVVRGGQVLAGVVHLPALGRTYAAAADGPATLNGAAIAPSGREDPDGARALASAGSLAEAEWPGGVPALKRSFRSSLAWRLCLVADGSFDAMLTLRDAWIWDVAAGALIAARAGAAVSDRNGTALDFAQVRLPGVLVAPAALHTGLIRRRTK
jgi:myo-inositol-1(or 4)-monophosphatase